MSFLKDIFNFGKETVDTLLHKAKISTIFDLFTEKVIPAVAGGSDEELKAYYEKRMNELNEFIYKL
ncbi:MAG: hypothetical protein ACTSU5_20930 [Promethearchaeota archaeon]